MFGDVGDDVLVVMGVGIILMGGEGVDKFWMFGIEILDLVEDMIIIDYDLVEDVIVFFI